MGHADHGPGGNAQVFIVGVLGEEFLFHLPVPGKATGGEDNGLGVDGILGAVLAPGFGTHNLIVRFIVQEFVGFGFQHILAAQFFVVGN